MSKLTVVFAERCAWRATYLRVNGVQRLHVGICPEISWAEIFGGIYLTRNYQWSFRFKVSLTRFRYPMGPIRSLIYGWQSRILMGLDGRYGWGTPAYRARKGAARA